MLVGKLFLIPSFRRLYIEEAKAVTCSYCLNFQNLDKHRFTGTASNVKQIHAYIKRNLHIKRLVVNVCQVKFGYDFNKANAHFNRMQLT